MRSKRPKNFFKKYKIQNNKPPETNSDSICKETDNKPNDDTLPTFIRTLSGKTEILLDESTPYTDMGGTVLFMKFLQEYGVLDRLINNCPLKRNSNNASDNREWICSFILAILSGKNRFSHIKEIYKNQILADIVGVKKLRSEDTVRDALKAISPEEGEAWLKKEIEDSFGSVLDNPWIMDLDSTVRTLYGHQEGVEVGYNPNKHGRGSYNAHVCWVGGQRAILDIMLAKGKEHGPVSVIDHYENILITLRKKKQSPFLIRGDVGFGGDNMLRLFEKYGARYISRLRSTSFVKSLIDKLAETGTWIKIPSQDGRYKECIEDKITLTGWKSSRKIIVMRTVITKIKESKKKKEKSNKKNTDSINNVKNDQLNLFKQKDLVKCQPQDLKQYEYIVLVTNDENLDIKAIPQLYLDRCDCENGFDEFKNQWGGAGFNTQSMSSNRLSSLMVALIYNLWSWYTRLAEPDIRHEAITSRPLLLKSVGRIVTHAGKNKILITPMHSNIELVKKMFNNIETGINAVKKILKAATKDQYWKKMIDYICDKIPLVTT